MLAGVVTCAFLANVAYASAATMVVAPNGAAGAVCTVVAPCAGLDDGYQRAQPGDTVEVSAGTYGGQRINADPDKPVGSAPVLIRPALGAAVTLGQFTSWANDVRYVGFNLTDDAVVRSGSNVVVEGFRAKKPYVWGPPRPAPAPNGVLFKGGTYYGGVSCSGGESAQVKAYDPNDTSSDRLPRNVTFDGIDLSGFKLPVGCSSAAHQDCIHTYAVDGFTLRNSRIHGCKDFGILFGSNGDARPDRILIENNFFWDSGIADIRPRGDAPGVEQFDDVTVRHNSTRLDLVGTATYRNALWQDNASLTAVNCQPGMVYGGNLAQRGTACSGDRRVTSLGFVAPAAGDFHLLAGSPAIGAARGAGHPVDDIDGGTRAAPLDVGADEFGVSGQRPPATTVGSATPTTGIGAGTRHSGTGRLIPDLGGAGAALRVGAKGRLRVRVTCRPEAGLEVKRCRGSVSLLARVDRRGRRTEDRHRIAYRTFSIRPGKSVALRVRIRTRGLRALRRGRVPASLIVALRDPAGQVRRLALSVTLERAPR